jgi:transposase-like protein
VFLTINGQRHYLWRAVDQDGHVLDILVRRRQEKAAAKKFFRKLLKGLTSAPRVIVAYQLGSYGAARRELLPGVEHRQHRYLNNRAENSHQPVSASGAWVDSSPQDTHNGSSTPMVQLHRASLPDITSPARVYKLFQN